MVGPQAASLNDSSPRLQNDALAILREAIHGLDPVPLTLDALQKRTDVLTRADRVTMVAAGKAAWPMASAAVSFLEARLAQGVVTAFAGAGVLPHCIQVIPGSHPLPDENSIVAATRALQLAASTREEGALLLVLLSGGASSMLALPPEGVTLEAKRRTIEVLSRAGVSISSLNCVRRHLSRIKGGRLAAAADGRCVTFAISDVHEPPDDPASIGSGPTVADSSTFADALRVLDEFATPTVPREVRQYLERGVSGNVPDTPKPGDPRLAGSEFQIIANRHTAMSAAAVSAAAAGFAVHVFDAAVSGEACQAGRSFVEAAHRELAGATRTCVIASGETTVTVRGPGKGGRNQEFVLGAAQALARLGSAAVVCSIGTDGIDGPTDAAGAIASGATVDAARARGVDLSRVLQENDAYSALAALDGLIRTGPTHTNVGDLCLLLT